MVVTAFVPALVRARRPPSSFLPRVRVPHRARSTIIPRRCRPVATADPSRSLSRPPPVVPNLPVAPSAPSTHARSPLRQLRVLWRFSRPHTIYGTLLSVVCLHAVAWLTGGWAGLLPAGATLLTALVPALLMNVFVVGLNQYFDVAIDRINKPTLPLAAGDLSQDAARSIIACALVGSLLFCLLPAAGWPLRAVLAGSALLGAAYSAPPVRLKRHPLLASVCIMSVRGVLVNAGFSLHAMQAHRLVALAPLVRYAVVFFVLFGIVIALLKDVPDIDGDLAYGIRTLTVRIGPQAVFDACVALLCMMFVGAAVFFAVVGTSRFAVPAAVVQLAVAGTLAIRARGVDAADRAQATDFYMLSWQAFYFEYLLLPFGV